MSKDPTRNIDRYKIRGGQMNTFEFQQNQGAVAQQQNYAGQIEGPDQETDLPPDKAKAERIRRLLAEHGESLLRPDEQPEPPETNIASAMEELEDDARYSNDETDDEEFAPTHGRPVGTIKEMIQSRRATDVVPDPEEVTERRSRKSTAGTEPAKKPSSRKTKSAAKEEPSTQAKSSTSTEPPAWAQDGATKSATEESTTAAGRKKQPSARKRSSPSSERKNVAKPAMNASQSASTTSASGRNARQTAARKDEKKAAPRKSVKNSASSSSGKQATSSSNTKRASTKKSASQNTAKSRKAISSKTTTRTANKTGRAATNKTRNKQSSRKSR